MIVVYHIHFLCVSYSLSCLQSLVRQLESRERHFNAVQEKGGALILDRHPAAGIVEAYMATLQSQWSWLLQLTSCLDSHLKHTVAHHQVSVCQSPLFSSLFQLLTHSWCTTGSVFVNPLYSLHFFCIRHTMVLHWVCNSLCSFRLAYFKHTMVLHRVSVC